MVEEETFALLLHAIMVSVSASLLSLSHPAPPLGIALKSRAGQHDYAIPACDTIHTDVSLFVNLHPHSA